MKAVAWCGGATGGVLINLAILWAVSFFWAPPAWLWWTAALVGAWWSGGAALVQYENGDLER